MFGRKVKLMYPVSEPCTAAFRKNDQMFLVFQLSAVVPYSLNSVKTVIARVLMATFRCFSKHTIKNVCEVGSLLHEKQEKPLCTLKKVKKNRYDTTPLKKINLGSILNGLP